MIKTVLLFSIIFLHSLTIEGQETLYDFVKPGDFQVGFADTILFDSTYIYEAYNYCGYKPHFIQIWYPITRKHKKATFLMFSDFLDTNKNKHLSIVREALKQHQQEIIIRDCIEENLESGQTNNFESYSYNDVFKLISSIKTMSSFNDVIEYSHFPVIIYHHGAQSNSFENFAMAEYFASRGFIFVSANFHLPYENTLFGLKPFNKLIKGEDENSLKTILRFARSLSSSPAVFFIGHSLGAQMGLRTFDHDTSIKGLISLETTIEFKTDFEKINQMWPEVFQKVIADNAYYPFPVLLCAATGQEKPFCFFENLNAQQITFAPTKEEFEHNAYTSIFYLRYFIDNEVPQADKEILKSRLQLYVKHLELINEFINGILDNEMKQGKEIIFVK
jgi:hypothetical protein